MAVLQTSGTYTYSPTFIDIASATLRLTQTINEEETATGAQLNNTLAAANAMVKGWQVSGINLWCEEECILFPQRAQTLYSLGSSSADYATLYQSLSQTYLSTTALTGATSVTVNNVSGFTSGNFIGLQLDSGVNFWTTISGAPTGNSVPLTAALPSQMSSSTTQVCWSYATPLVRPLRCYTMRRYIYASGIENPMIMLSRTDYQNLPNKQTPGTITQAFFDPQTGQGAYQQPLAQVNLWPSPVDYTSGFRFTAQRPLQDLANLANLPDLPVEWTAAIKWNLAQEIMGELGTPTDQQQLINTMAPMWFQRIENFNREPEGVRFGVAFEPGYRVGI
jgi:hypothetical protein